MPNHRHIGLSIKVVGVSCSEEKQQQDLTLCIQAGSKPDVTPDKCCSQKCAALCVRLELVG